METKTKNIKYDYYLLNTYCNENNIILSKRYNKTEKINCETKIEGKCIKCENTFCKTFRMLLKSKAYCKYHTVKETRRIYNYDYLQKYCNDNNICLIKKYEKENVNIKTKIEGKCIKCENTFCKVFEQLLKTNAYCKYHTEINRLEKIKQTCLEKYGVEHQIHSQIIKDKMKKTCLEKYGVETPIQNEKIKDIIKQTILTKYGVEHISQSQEIKNKKKQTNKIKQTVLKKYGVEHISQSQEIKNKIKQTVLKKYGVEHISQSQEIKDKIKHTCLTKYGVINPLLSQTVKNKIKQQLQKIRNKSKQTCLEKYGVLHPAQNTEIMEKISKNSYNLKNYTLPSGNTIKLQGYEHFAFDELLKEFTENEVINGCKNVPRIWYEDENGKKRRHYVDIFIPSQNRCIEIKSTWTYKKKSDTIFKKQTAAKELGYQYEIWVYNGKGEKIECYT